MQKQAWITGLAVAALLFSVTGCSNPDNNASPDGRNGVNTVEIAPGQELVRVPQWDNKNIDVDGDGDREHLSGRNNLNNPSVDLRSFAHPNGTPDTTNGVQPHSFTADRISDPSTSIDGVANTRALVAGRTVIVGANLEQGVRPAQRAYITQLIRQRILVQAPEFQRVHITTDKAQVREIQRIADEVCAGHSLTLFNDEVMELTRNIPAVGPNAMPAVPAK